MWAAGVKEVLGPIGGEVDEATSVVTEVVVEEVLTQTGKSG